MKDKPKVKAVDRIDNCVLVEFEGESGPAVFPAELLHAAKGVAAMMAEKNARNAVPSEHKLIVMPSPSQKAEEPLT
jgi:hypothetical protein